MANDRLNMTEVIMPGDKVIWYGGKSLLQDNEASATRKLISFYDLKCTRFTRPLHDIIIPYIFGFQLIDYLCELKESMSLTLLLLNTCCTWNYRTNWDFIDYVNALCIHT